MSALHSFAVYRRRFRHPFRYGTSAMHEREGVVLRRRVESGFLYSEAAPLASHSRDSLAAVLRSLEACRDRDLGPTPSNQGASLPPSLRSAVDGMQLLAPAQPFTPVRTNALLPAAGAEFLHREIARLHAAGFQCFKCKLPPATQDWSELAELLSCFPGLRFRLDANRCLDPASLERLIGALARHGATDSVEYIEEPFLGVWSMSSFSGSPVPLAADESAWDTDSALALCSSANAPAVIIVKPTVYGALLPLERLEAELEGRGKKMVVSSALECEPGRRVLLAFLGRKSRAPAGLSTGFLLEESFLPDRPLWEALPPLSASEQAWLNTLAWRDLPC